MAIIVRHKSINQSRIMEQKQRFNCIDEQLFADVCGTVKTQEGKQTNGQVAFAIVDAEVLSLDSALKGGKSSMAVAIRAVESHAGNKSCVSDVGMLSLLKDQLSEVTGKRFTSISIMSKNDVLVTISDYLVDVDESCYYLTDVVDVVNEIYSNGFIISAE